jgi:hypothetical protein
MVPNAELDRLIADLRTHPLAEGELREIKEGVYVSLTQSRPEGFEKDFCLSAGGRMYFFFRKAPCGSAARSPLLERKDRDLRQQTLNAH